MNIRLVKCTLQKCFMCLREGFDKLNVKGQFAVVINNVQKAYLFILMKNIEFINCTDVVLVSLDFIFGSSSLPVSKIYLNCPPLKSVSCNLEYNLDRGCT